MEIPSNLLPVQLQRDEEATTRWFHLATRGTLVEHIKNPDYWQHTAARLLRTPNKGLGDVIRVLAEDGSFDIDVTVLAVDPRGLWMQVREMRLWEAPADKPVEAPERADSDGYTVEFAGPHKWRIVNSAGDVVAHGYPSKPDAQKALINIKAEKRAA